MIARSSNLSWRPHSRGFTLVELLLVVVLLLVFVGAAVIGTQSIAPANVLNTGALEFEGLLRFARAQAANLGRRVRVNFPHEPNATTNQTAAIQLSWEPNPLGAPDIFEELPGSNWDLKRIDENICVRSVRRLDDVADDEEELADFDWTGEEHLSSEDEMPAIMFRPDGSGDSAEIILSGRDTEDTRQVALRVHGMTGSISRTVLTESELPMEAPSVSHPVEDVSVLLE